MIYSQVNAVDLTDNLNHGLIIISKWAHQWKMLFNPEIDKQSKYCFRIKRPNKHIHAFFEWVIYHKSQRT